MTEPAKERTSSPLVEILTIGREILDGRVIDTNSVWMAEKLGARGLIPRYAQKVDDEVSRVIEAFGIARSRSDIIVVTGGLGPTSDDLTAECFARFLGEPLLLREEALAWLKAWFARANRVMYPVQEKQAYFPQSCGLIENREGTAPGFFLEREGKAWYFMPGVPREMKRMFEDFVLPRLPRVEGYRTHTWATQFTSEGELQNRLNPVTEALPEGFEVTYRTRFPENHIGLHGVCASAERASAFDRASAAITATLGDDVFSESEGALRSLEKVVSEQLKAGGHTLASVESCTGGLIAHRLTQLAGSSEVFWSAWVVYDNHAKLDLGMDEAILKTYGAVSPQTAVALAEAGLRKLQSFGARHPLCIATTGVAGPGGGSEAKPVGLCHIGLAQAGKPTLTEKIQGRAHLQREDYKLLFSQKALDLIRRSTLA